MANQLSRANQLGKLYPELSGRAPYMFKLVSIERRKELCGAVEKVEGVTGCEVMIRGTRPNIHTFVLKVGVRFGDEERVSQLVRKVLEPFTEDSRYFADDTGSLFMQ